MRIRAAGIEELPEISLIERTCFQRDRYPRPVLQSMLSGPGFLTFLAEDGSPVGAATIYVQSDSKEGQLVSIAVMPEHRGMGIAKALLERAISATKDLEAKYMFLEVDVTNIAALNLYLHYEFRIRGTIKDYYGPGRDAYYMERSI